MGKAQEKREAAEKAAAKKAEKDAKKAALKEARAAKKAFKAQVDRGVPRFRDRFTSFNRVVSGNDGRGSFLCRFWGRSDRVEAVAACQRDSGRVDDVFTRQRRRDGVDVVA